MSTANHQPWCTYHAEDGEDSYCHTAEFKFGRPVPDSEYSTGRLAGSLEVSRGLRDDDDVVWLLYSQQEPPSHLIASLNRNALAAIRAALLEDPHGFTHAVLALSDAIVRPAKAGRA